MFILRAAFWLSVVVLILPGDPRDDSSPPGADAWRALVATRAAIADLSGMCERQPDVCDKGGSALQAFGTKVRWGADLIARAANGEAAPARNGEAKAPVDPAVVAMPPAQRPDTLTESDSRSRWRAPVREGRKA